ncbi:MAG: Hsp70 family protein [Propioniciclava sp.]|uniref:Hsp70 family protein n=1 Tax=Propioniciclava sp. TaxID=2038686 RepID=UPI0039E35D13
MKLGIDFGTTRTIVALVDRGNYPVVSFTDHRGDAVDHVPSVVTRVGDELVFGFDALKASDEGAALTTSFKRQLADGSIVAGTVVDVDGLRVELLDLVTGFLRYLAETLRTASNITRILEDGEPLQAVVAVPAHAHSAQRFLTLEAFRAAGFDVVGMLNEPSAAGFEFTHRQPRSINRKRTKVVVYDLGGGTFDASLVRVDDLSHEVVTSVGINRLGGDDFDDTLMDLALAAAGHPADLTERDRTALRDDCRAAKENLSPRSKRIALEVGPAPVSVAVEDFYTAADPLVEASLTALEPLLGGLDAEQLEAAEVAGIYLVGGASGLPLVARVLRERFGRRVHRSPHPAASTAIGLAIAADTDSGFHLTDRLSRGFGVFRELDSGAGLSFDPLFDRDQHVSPDADVVVTRRYVAAHNVGVFRFVEHSALGGEGEPTGDVIPLGELRVPFDRALRDGRGLGGVEVVRVEGGPLIEERYTIDRHGIITVRLTDLDDGWFQESSLGR